MLELEPIAGLRVAADPAALDGARWHAEGGQAIVLRLAPDDAIGLGAREVEVDDEHAIVENERGFVAARLTAAELETLVVPRLEWPLPATRPALAQGLVAGVPAKLWLTTDGAILLTPVALAAELRERLG